MDSRPSLWWLLPFSATFLLSLMQNQQFAIAVHRPAGTTLINVSKNFYFPNFNPNLNPYKIQDMITLLGSSKISQGFIQIPDASAFTVDHPTAYRAGRAIYASPVRLFNPLTRTPGSFQTTFSFKLTAATNDGSVSGEGHGGEGGLAFIIVPDEFTVGRPGPWLGILNDVCNHYKVFYVEFDASLDPEFGDPNDDHVGVNLGSVVSFKIANIPSKANVSLHSNVVHRAWITYNGQRRRIDVHLGSDGHSKPSEPILSFSLDLSPFLQEYMFVGFSASAGKSTKIHSVLSWNFSSTTQALLRKPSARICHRNVARQVSKYTDSGYRAPPSSFMIFVAVLGLCTLALISFYCNSMRRERTDSLILLVDKKQKPTSPKKARRYTVVEVFKATRGFGKSEVLGSDFRGVLYRGTLPNGRHVAMKRYLKSSRLATRRVLQRIDEFSQINHPGLTPIRGWCCEKYETIIVFNYFPNGSLDRWLYGLGVLPWSLRFKLIKEIAEALCFLHSKGLAHGNFKTSSVFLDLNYQAVLGDYDFIFCPGEKAGPAESVASMNEDVFRFGMLVLETIAGKKTVGEGVGEKSILGFAWSMHESGEKAKVVDERVLGHCANSEQAVRVLEIGLSCTLSKNDGRPCMEEVVQLLNTQKPVPQLPPGRPAELFPKRSSSERLAGLV
ncbi:probable L-type lectin-domain containing receptor kinase S.7 [Juglans microcarpa x Juglans regia]|uniref:probable L-type lectin-domain containing receptor kinase S.7 n=1 Tax=Juglans microcarpa x Juglans regia TaxID=2249226 RepID=UPI001B7F42BE|nr:probable L-type lectin-domain containing receptor kinase S.7 [Juglans microcarpa x Juglans regia]